MNNNFTQLLAILLCTLLLSCATSKSQRESGHYSNQSAPLTKIQTDDDLSLCYSLNNTAKKVVLDRNQGMSYEEQVDKHNDKYPQQDQTIALLNDFTYQVYLHEKTNSIESTIEFHKQCIALQQPNIQYQPRALSVCPMAASAIDLAMVGKKMGMPKERTLNLIKKNNSGFSFAFDGGFEKLVNDTFEQNQQDGLSYYRQCMSKAHI